MEKFTIRETYKPEGRFRDRSIQQNTESPVQTGDTVGLYSLTYAIRDACIGEVGCR